MSDLQTAIQVWSLITIGLTFLGILGTICTAVDADVQPKSHRNFARLALTGWAWPVWVVAFVVYGIGWMVYALWVSADVNHKETP